MAEQRTPRTQARGNLLFTPVVPDFSGIGENIDQIANQLYQYQREKEIRKQKRRDIMMRQYMEMTGNIEKPEVIHSNIQKKINKRINNLQGKLATEIAPDIEGNEEDWEALQRGQQMINEGESDISKYVSWGKQWKRDREMIHDDWENWSEETKKGWSNYKGESAPDYPMKKRILSVDELYQENENEFDMGGISFGASINADSGELIGINATEYLDRFWVTDKYGEVVLNEEGKPKRAPIQKRKQIQLANKSYRNRETLINDLKTRPDSKLIDKEEGIYEVNGKLYSPLIKKSYNGEKVYSIGEYNYYEYVHKRFPIKPVVSREKLDKEIEKEELTQAEKDKRIDYEKEGKFIEDLPEEISIEKSYGFGDPFPGKSFKKEAKLFSIPDENITFDYNQLNNAYVKEKGKWKKKDAQSYVDAKLVGIIDIEGKKYGKLGVTLSEKNEMRNGKQVYDYILRISGGEDQLIKGTMQEMIDRDNSYDTKADVKRALEYGMIWKSKIAGKRTDVLVPVEDNPEIKEFYNFKNEPDSWGKTINKQESDNILQGY